DAGRSDRSNHSSLERSSSTMNGSNDPNDSNGPNESFPEEHEPDDEESAEHHRPRRRLHVLDRASDRVDELRQSSGTAAGQRAVFTQALRNQHVPPLLRLSAVIHVAFGTPANGPTLSGSARRPWGFRGQFVVFGRCPIAARRSANVVMR